MPDYVPILTRAARMAERLPVAPISLEAAAADAAALRDLAAKVEAYVTAYNALDGSGGFDDPDGVVRRAARTRTALLTTLRGEGA